MKNKSVSNSVIIALLATSFMLPMSVFGFWPFDAGNGQVQGVTTEGSGFFGLMQKVFTRFGGAPPNTGMPNYYAPSGASGSEGGYYAPRGATGSMGEINSQKTRLDQAVKDGK